MSENTLPPTVLRRLAIALKYNGEGAPRVTAKGQGEIGERIMEIARLHNVPMRADAQLCQVLAQVPLGDEIPESLYVAVAEVLAFAYRIGWSTGDAFIELPENAEDVQPTGGS
ncbi:hypothetical protein BJI67_05875 [Acidihalobacter aeolianus]|uniref:Flagellar biosynthetic protein FlhB n=1 Tax=Acidihalobacter aeolianus TaxID=2792603 RepID=A0A1D8K6R9_9GAMM|nr:EscU/YscU/HrcU family type III secretion system export apparatus switch protein [Acidihalobacter aeolianus]AOV16653.1 hypothetical protein BJI67_05875 [Acidihalobacter aeolianus]